MLTKQNMVMLALFVAIGLMLAGCQAAPQNTPEVVVQDALPTVVGNSALIVEGNLVPAEYVDLSFNMGGIIVDVLVNEGDTIEAGQVIAVLDQRERLAAAVANAELELVNARQALEQLDENSSVETAAAQQEVANARDAVRDAERALSNLTKGTRQTDIDSATADVIILKDRLDDALEDYASYENKREDSVTRAQYLSKMADAQQRYDDAVRLLNNLEGKPSDIDLAIAEANLALAQARLALAEQEYTDVQNGPDPDDLESAQARLTAAESGLQAAQASLADAELRAPISGSVVKLDLKKGEQALPGVPAVVLADVENWMVETDDLNEMEIPRVSVGQKVIVTPDALPDLELSGAVESISELFVEKQGDVTYTAKIALNDDDPDLRWGMTVAVEFISE
jgi:HlyD family secretion protein